MMGFDAVPLWLAAIVALFLVIGSTLTFLGALGLVRLASFYDRIHAPTLGTSWGTAGILLASLLLYSVVDGRVILHELVIGTFVMITTPVTLMILGRAALHRDRLGLETRADEVWAAPGDDDPEAEPEPDPAADLPPEPGSDTISGEKS